MEEEQPSDLIASLAIEGAAKIVLLVMDGLGGIRTDDRGSELFAANTPNLDRLADEGSTGVHTLVSPGITPGSGAGHLALFGYDPRRYVLGRGVLSAAGLGVDLKPGQVAARVNFCTLGGDDLIADRRAGRIATEENLRLCNQILSALDDGDVRVTLIPEREHRALLVLDGEGLSPRLADTDPGREGMAPLPPRGLTPAAERTAAFLARFLEKVRQTLRKEHANFILLRGFETHRELPGFWDRYKLRGAGIASYPMYLGLSRLLGMQAIEGADFGEEVGALREAWESFDFFYIHQKKTDSAGENGDFDGKVAAIEEVDSVVPLITELSPDVICVTGDHATPSQLRAHSWHPVPFLLWGPDVGRDRVAVFDEESALTGGFGRQRAVHLMALMLGAAGRLGKFGP